MMSLTKKQAITNHRKMWNWIADETERRKCCVNKWEYFYETGFPEVKIPFANCFCCGYAISQPGEDEDVDYCMFCPVQWNTTHNSIDEKCLSGEYGQWSKAFREGDYKRATKIARKIANLSVAETEE